jgi:hypothetical protein
MTYVYSDSSVHTSPTPVALTRSIARDLSRRERLIAMAA